MVPNQTNNIDLEQTILDCPSMVLNRTKNIDLMRSVEDKNANKQFVETYRVMDMDMTFPENITTSAEWLQYPEEGKTKRWPQYLAACLATLVPVCGGSVMGWSSPALPYLQDHLNHTVDHLTETEASWVGSLLPVGALLGALPSGYLANKVGRKTTLLGLAGPYLVGWALLAVGNKHVPLILAARLTAGLALGAGSVIAPIYNEEIAEVSIRGALGVYYDLMVGVGVLWSYIAGAYLPYFWLAVASAVLPLLFLASFTWMPESPVYLVARGRDAEAERALRWLRGTGDVREELKLLKVAAVGGGAVTWGSTGLWGKVREAFIDPPPSVKAVKIVAGLMVCRPLSGINVILFYTVTIFRESGSSLSPFLSTVLVGVFQVVATLVSGLMVDQVGRRALLLFSDVTMALCYALLALYFYFKEQGAALGAYQWVPLLLLVTYITVFNLGFGPIPWFMVAELVPQDAKGWAGGLAVAVNWTLVFVVTKVFSSMLQHLGTATTFGVFCLTCSLGSMFVALVVPETRGKSREEIQGELANSR
uniref:Major facilitator superfamily (MFS) profile domain-containing protein n=1 Tax=Timema tahoe TaxID=61484 RepID=A0A7R9IMN0_9NEOP|nr:unnamed protein product [Timema tahoe]